MEKIFEFLIGSMPIRITKKDVESRWADGNTISDADYIRFGNLCQQHKLNPFNGEVMLFSSKDGNGRILIGKDGYFRMADSNPDYDGIEDGVIVVKKGTGDLIYRNGCVVPPDCQLYGGWAKVFSKQKSHPKYVEVAFSEYNSGKLLWATKPATMINKVAKCQALRDAFPATYAGTYAEDEVSDIPVKTGEKPVEEKRLPNLEDALNFEFKTFKKLEGKKLSQIIKEAEKPQELLEKLVALNKEAKDEALVVLDAIKSGKYKGK